MRGFSWSWLDGPRPYQNPYLHGFCSADLSRRGFHDLGQPRIVYFLEGLVFLTVAGVLLSFSRERKPLEIKQTIAVTGPLKVNEIHCPNCGALVDATKTEVVDGKPFVTCHYCGKKFELTEEPTW